MTGRFTTPDLCDAFGGIVQVAEPLFRDYGAVRRFAGPIATVRTRDDNTLVRQVLETPGHGRVLVVDGAGSLRCALLGGRLAVLAQSNGWSGILVNGCIRDSGEIATIPVGVKALNTSPVRSEKAGRGEQNVVVTFAGVTFEPRHFLYADDDGIVVADRDLSAG